jgi:integrase/recombinase XerC
MSRVVTIQPGKPIAVGNALDSYVYGVDSVRQAAVDWATAIAIWLTLLKACGRAPSTIKLRRYYVERFAARCGGDPFAVTLDQVSAWLASDDWGSETRKSARAGLVSFYGWAVDSGRLAEWDSPVRTLPPVGVELALPRPVPDAVFQQGLWFADDKEQLMLLLAGYAGLRRAEIAQVHAEDFDWETGQLLVHGKGRKQRRVPIHPDLGRLVRAELDRRRLGKVGRGFRLYVEGIGPDSYLFPGKYGHVTPGTIGKVLDRLLAGKWTGHTLRHRFATKAYAPERDLRAVQELLGHSKPETTARYVETPPEAKQAAVLAVGVRAA